MTACCGPARKESESAMPTTRTGVPLRDVVVGLPGSRPAMVTIAAQTFVMGTDSPGYRDDGEGPAHEVEVAEFALGVAPVTNREFAAFVDVCGYITQAERFGWSFVFGGLLPDDFADTRGVAAAPWWREVHGADWRRPEGPHSSIEDRLDHPVVHMSWFDAQAFCDWAGGRLPTEAEWECAARGGLVGTRFPWGDDLEPAGQHAMNVFQGVFPHTNTAHDGWLGTSPVCTFEPNAYGLVDMTGNVWEWCSDWFDPQWYHHSPRRDPRGPDAGVARVMRGGSYLCHHSYCSRYRVDARSASTPDSTTGNVGFRIAVGSKLP